jgi:hypothetical protein
MGGIRRRVLILSAVSSQSLFYIIEEKRWLHNSFASVLVRTSGELPFTGRIWYMER